MRWPKAVVVHGLGIPVESWDELDELVRRYGSAALAVGQGRAGPAPRPAGRLGAGLSPPDRALLQQFVEAGARGLLTTQISPAVGKRGKGWARVRSSSCEGYRDSQGSQTGQVA